LKDGSLLRRLGLSLLGLSLVGCSTFCAPWLGTDSADGAAGAAWGVSLAWATFRGCSSSFASRSSVILMALSLESAGLIPASLIFSWYASHSGPLRGANRRYSGRSAQANFFCKVPRLAPARCPATRGPPATLKVTPCT